MGGPEAAPPQVDTLPPPDARLIRRHERIDTPLDDRGLVDVPALIQQAKEQVDPNYVWPTAANMHHFYWPAAYYPGKGAPGMTKSYAEFRDLPIHKGWMPTAFHNWIHKITLPPPVPDPEVIMYRMEGWRVANKLFEEAQESGFRAERRAAARRRQVIADNPELQYEIAGQSEIAQEVMHGVLEQYFGDERDVRASRVRGLLARLRPKEVHPEPSDLAQELGQIMIQKRVELVPLVLNA